MYSSGPNDYSHVDEIQRDDDKIKKRGNYRCSKCGLYKKGHTCVGVSNTKNNLKFENLSPQYIKNEVQHDQSKLLERIKHLEDENEKLRKLVKELKSRNHNSLSSYSSDNSDSDIPTEQDDESMERNHINLSFMNQPINYFNDQYKRYRNHPDHFTRHMDEVYITGSPSCTTFQERMANQYNLNVDEYYHNEHNGSYCF